MALCPLRWRNVEESGFRRRTRLGYGLLAALGIQSLFGTVMVDGPSMSPALESGAYLLLAKSPMLAGGIRPGDIVVIRDPASGRTIVKRVYRTEGEDVDVWNAPLEYPGRERLAPFRVPEGTVHVLGDNALESEDSRMFGPVPSSRIVGKVVARL